MGGFLFVSALILSDATHIVMTHADLKFPFNAQVSKGVIMSSTSRHEPEHHHRDLAGVQAVARIQEMVKKAETCFFCTSVDSGGSGSVRPMNALEVDQKGCIWFLSADDSHKNKEIAMDPMVQLHFQGDKHGEFLTLQGTATASHDKARIAQLWKNIFRNWFTDGQDDPRITVIKFSPTYGYYWDMEHNAVVSGAKIMFGALTGQTLDDSVEGELVT